MKCFMRSSPGIVLLFFFLLIGTLQVFAQNDVSGNEYILRVKHTADFTVTGNGSAAQWSNSEWNLLPQRSSKTLQNAGWYTTPERITMKDVEFKTSFKILYSDKGIYCLFKCEDSSITATLKEDFADLFNEDVVEVFFWPDTTMPVYFEYELSPLNYELPILILNNNGNVMGWKPRKYEGARKTTHAVRINEKNETDSRISWTAEFFIPFGLLYPMKNAPPKKGTQWRANFYRIDYDRVPVYSSWRLTRRNFHDFERFGTLVFE